MLYIFNFYRDECTSPLRVCGGVMAACRIITCCMPSRGGCPRPMPCHDAAHRQRRTSHTHTLDAQVLATFLRVFSSFDWDTKCITLQGPVPIGMLAPDAPPPPAATDARAPSPNPGPPSLDPLLLEGLRLQFGQEALGIAPPGRHFQVVVLFVAGAACHH